MIIHPTTGIPVSSFERLRENAQWLRDFLTQRNIKIHPSSVLHQAIYVSENLPDWSRNSETFPANLKVRGVLSHSIGLSFLVRAIWEASKHSNFEKVSKLLPNLAEENPLMTEAAQSTQQRNFVFELEIGCLFLAAGIAAESLTEPDVRIRLNNETWNLPCKMIYSLNSVTLGDRIEDGITQLLRHEADYGIVVVGISNRIDHDSFMPLLDKDEDIWGSFPTEVLAMNCMGPNLSSTF